MRISDFKYRFPGSEAFNIELTGITLSSGLISFLHGSSGCGKTTMLNLLGGVLHSTLSKSTRAYFPVVGYVMHESALIPWESVRSNLVIEERLRHRKFDYEEFYRFCIRMHIDPELNLKKRGSNLSLGTRQRIEIAKSLAFRPNLLLLDEAFSGIDVATRLDAIELVLEQAKVRDICVIATAHQSIDLLRLADNIIWMADGKINKIINISVPSCDRVRLSSGDIYSLDFARQFFEFA